MRPDDETIAAALLAIVDSRTTTVCPSEVARALTRSGADWRPLMPHVRAVAARLQDGGVLAVTQRGAAVDAERAQGPIRLRARPPRDRGRRRQP